MPKRRIRLLTLRTGLSKETFIFFFFFRDNNYYKRQDKKKKKKMKKKEEGGGPHHGKKCVCLGPQLQPELRLSAVSGFVITAGAGMVRIEMRRRREKPGQRQKNARTKNNKLPTRRTFSAVNKVRCQVG